VEIYDYTIYDMLSRNVISFRKNPAWFEAEMNETFTFAQFKKKVDRLAAGLQKNGVKKGDRIGVIGKNSIGNFLVCIAAAAVGAIVVPLNWRLSAEEMGYNLTDCEPVILFSDKEFQETIEGLRSKLPSVRKYFDLGQEKGSFFEFDALMDNEGNFNRPESLSSNDGFVIIYTAAVAGQSRGALLSHVNVLLACWGFTDYLNLGPADVHLSILPFFHVAGLFSSIIALQVGALNVNMNRYEADAVVKLIKQKKVSVLFEFSPILSQILEQNEKTRGDISSLRAVAGLDTPETIEKYQKTTKGTFYSVYGQTEVSGFATLARYDERPGSAGKMLPFVELGLVDDYDRQVQIGHTGEIVTRGPMVFKGYWNLPEETEYTFRNGWHHTGDLGRLDEDGFLWYAGRKAEKELIKPGGENVYPAEVEKVILEHPAIEKVVVFGVPDPKWKEGIKAVCQLKEGKRLKAQELIDFVGGKIARYKKPQYVEFISELPLLEDGSPDRVKAKALYGGRLKCRRRAALKRMYATNGDQKTPPSC